MNSDIDSGDENVSDGDATVLRGNDYKQNKTKDNHDLAPELKKEEEKNQKSSILINENILICLLLMVLNETFLFLH